VYNSTSVPESRYKLSNICSRLLTSDLDFSKRHVRHFFPVQEKAVDVPYCIIFQCRKTRKISRQGTTGVRYPFSHFDFQSRKQNRSVFFVYKNYKLHINLVSHFVPYGAKHRGFGCRNIDQAGLSVSSTSKSRNNKGRIEKTRNVCRPGSKREEET
jgi:hypothetical protein